MKRNAEFSRDTKPRKYFSRRKTLNERDSPFLLLLLHLRSHTLLYNISNTQKSIKHIYEQQHSFRVLYEMEIFFFWFCHSNWEPSVCLKTSHIQKKSFISSSISVLRVFLFIHLSMSIIVRSYFFHSPLFTYQIIYFKEKQSKFYCHSINKVKRVHSTHLQFIFYSNRFFLSEWVKIFDNGDKFAKK